MISGDGASRNGATGFTEESAEAVLREACGAAGLNTSGAELLRLGSNAVYRLTTPPVIVRTARDPDSLGFGWHTRAEYESFVFHYGFDLMNWPGYAVLADVRERMMTLWLGQQVTTSGKSAEEFARRVHTIRTGGSRREWNPF